MALENLLLSGNATEALLRRIAFDPHSFWSAFYALKFSTVKFTMPPMNRLGAKTRNWIDDGSLLPIFLHAKITQDAYPEDWIRSNWDRRNDLSLIKRRPLPGRWVVVELVHKPDWLDTKGYGGGNDRLARELDLQERFNVAWDDLRTTLCPKAANLWGLKNAGVRPLTAEEWNLFGNVLLELNRLHTTQFPDLGATGSWEWTESTCGSDRRVLVGNRGYGGLAAVSSDWSSAPNASVGFRLLGFL